MAALIATIPLQIVCQLIVTGSPGVTNNGTTDTSANPPPPQTQSFVLPEGYVAYPDVGTAYKIHNDTVLWKVARRRCISENANLAVIDSREKFEHASNQRKFKDRVTHVGIHSLFDDDEWVSVKTGFPVTTIPWASGEPNGRLHCVTVKHDSGGLGNFNCATALGDFICEIPIPYDYAVEGSSLGEIVPS